MSLHHQMSNPKPWKQSKTIPTFKVVQRPTNYQTWNQSYSIYTICTKRTPKSIFKGIVIFIVKLWVVTKHVVDDKNKMFLL
jgi:hypothetical protein